MHPELSRNPAPDPLQQENKGHLPPRPQIPRAAGALWRPAEEPSETLPRSNPLALPSPNPPAHRGGQRGGGVTGTKEMAGGSIKNQKPASSNLPGTIAQHREDPDPRSPLRSPELPNRPLFPYFSLFPLTSPSRPKTSLPSHLNPPCLYSASCTLILDRPPAALCTEPVQGWGASGKVCTWAPYLSTILINR